MKPLRKNFVGFKYGQSFVSKVYIGEKILQLYSSIKFLRESYVLESTYTNFIEDGNGNGPRYSIADRYLIH